MVVTAVGIEPGLPTYKACLLTTTLPWLMAIDTIGKLPVTTSGNRYALTCIDLLTSYVIAVPMLDKPAESLVEAYLSGILSRTGASMVCLSDNGSELKNNQMNMVLKQLGIKHIFQPLQTSRQLPYQECT